MEVQYDAQGRMKYHPDYHPNHKKPYSTKGLAYIYKYYGFGKVKEIALALGRTELMIRLTSKYSPEGMFENYKTKCIQRYKLINSHDNEDFKTGKMGIFSYCKCEKCWNCSKGRNI